MKTSEKYSLNEKSYWKVSTEGDCEGRSTRDLGVHYGYLDDIAFSLADQSYYALKFSLVNPHIQKPIKRTKVMVSLDIDSETWNMDSRKRVQFFENILKNRDVIVKESNYYACVELIVGKDDDARKEREKEIVRQNALAKLSNEELKALGLK